MKKSFQIEKFEGVNKSHIRQYVNFVQERGKYICGRVDPAKHNLHARRDYGKSVSINTINNYVRNIKAFFNWLSDE